MNTITDDQKDTILCYAAMTGLWERVGLDVWAAIDYFSQKWGGNALYCKGLLKTYLMSKDNCLKSIKPFSGNIKEELYTKLENLVNWQPLFALLFGGLYENSYITIDDKRKCLSLENLSYRKFYNLYKTVPEPRNKGRNPLKLSDLDDIFGLESETMKHTTGGPRATKGTLENLKQEFGNILIWLV
ncbi:MAG: hypothetical protein J6U56_04510 [Spirochaetia bacterium]|nr:hypothetical protein [Spirochaetia bacterium]